MAGGVVGSVSISVLPDLTKFYRQLKTKLQAAEKDKSFQPNIKAVLSEIDIKTSAIREAASTLERAFSYMPARITDIDVDKRALLKAREKLGDLTGSVAEVSLNKKAVEEAKERLNHEFDDVEATVNADADTAMAHAKLAALTRPRTVHIGTVFEDSGKIAQALGAVSGMRSLDKTTKALRDLALNIDTVAVKSMAAFGALGALSDLALGGAAGVVNFGAGLAKAAKASAALPAALTASALGVGTFVAALKDTKTVLGDLAPAFHNVQDSLSVKFWAQAEAPLRRMVDGILPDLQRGFDDVAVQAGKFTASLAEAVRESATTGRMRTMFDNTAQAIGIASDGARDMAGALIELGTVGGQYLPRMAGWLNDIAARFKAFIDGAAATGELNKWIEQGVQGLRDLGSIVKNLGSAWSGLYKATSQAGVGMGGLVTLTKQFADMVNKPSFAKGLATILEGARKGADGLRQGLADIGSTIGDIAPLVSDMLATAGQQIGKLGSALSRVLASPDVQRGLAGLQSGFMGFTDAIARALTALTPAIGSALSALGKIADSIGSVLGGALSVAAPALSAMLDIIAALPAPLLAAVASFIALKKALDVGQLTGVTKAFTLLGDAVSTAQRAYAAGVRPITAFGAGLGVVQSAAVKAGAALKAAFIANAPLLAITALATAIGYFVGKSQEAAQKQEDLRATLDETTGAVTKQTAAFLATDEDVKALVASYEAIGGAAEDVYGAIQGNNTAYATYVKTLRAAEEAGDLTAAAASKLFNSMLEERSAVDQARMAQEEANKATQAAIDKRTRQSQALQNVLDAQQRLTDKLKAASDAQFAANKALADWADASATYQQAVAGAAGSFEKQQVALDEYAQSAIDVMETQRELGVSHDDLNTKMGELSQNVYDAALAFYGSEEKARAYVEQLQLVPDSVLTEAKLNTEPAMFQLGEFIVEINEAEGTVTINGTDLPAQTTLGELLGDVNESDGTVTISGNKIPAETTLAQFLYGVDTSSGTSSIYGDQSNALAALANVISRYNASSGTTRILGRDEATKVADAAMKEVDKKSGTATINARDNATPVIRSIGSQLAGLTRNYTIGIGGMAVNANGSIMRFFRDGGIQSFANGTERHIAQIAPAGSYRLWAEPETGGEAYIPLSRAKRSRSEQILAEVADEFGFFLTHKNGTAYADGGISGSNGGTAGGGAVYNISVNVDAQALRDVHDIASFVDMLHVYQRMGIHA